METIQYQVWAFYKGSWTLFTFCSTLDEAKERIKWGKESVNNATHWKIVRVEVYE